MKNNRLYAGLALSLCLIAVPVCVQAGASGAASTDALHKAAGRGDLAAVQACIRGRADVNEAMRGGLRPIAPGC